MSESRVAVTPSGLRLGADVLPVRSGEVHYWRLDPGDWPRVLDAVAELGFTCVSSYVPWCKHEVAPGECDFDTGALAVGRFLDLAHERGLRAIVRPGPNCGAELETSGWPRRILDDVECQARRPDGRGYLLPTATHHAFMPSYASRRTLQEIGRWYDAVVPVLASRQWPHGPVVAAHVDNEMGYHFQSHPFALDYHADAVAQWHEFTGRQADPPRDGRDGTEPDRLAWVRFREHHLRRSLTTLAAMLRERGLDQVPLLHNDYPRTTTPFDSAALEQEGVVDVAAGDIYATRHGGRYVRDYARHLSGTSRLPWLAESGVGWITLPWLLPMAIDPADAGHGLWRSLSGGVRAFNVFMLVERDRWYGAPVSERGEQRPHAEVYRAANTLLAQVGWHELRRDARVLLLENRDESRRAAANAVCGDLVPPFAQVLPLDRRLFDGDTSRTDRIAEWDRGVRAALDAAGVDWDEATSSALPPDLDRYDLVVLPCVDTVGSDAAVALAKAAAAGTRVVVGPGEPAVDESLEPLSPGSGGGAGGGLADGAVPWMVVADPAAVAASAPAPAWSCPADAVDVTVFRHPDGAEVLVAVNGGDAPVATTLRAADGRTVPVDLAPWAATLTDLRVAAASPGVSRPVASNDAKITRAGGTA